MLDGLLGSGTLFDRARSQAADWIRNHLPTARTLSRSELRHYGGRNFVVGWSFDLPIASVERTLHVLLDDRFPYSPVRIALASEDFYRHWPHVELQGVLCLPLARAPLEDAAGALNVAVGAAANLIARCTIDPQFVSDELMREFVSYWGYSCLDQAADVRTLIDLRNPASREVAVWFGQKFTLVGESAGQVRAWLQHIGRDEKPEISRGIFGKVSEPPIFPFPSQPNELLKLLERTCPDAAALLVKDIAQDSRSVIVLAAEAEAKIGVVACALKHPTMRGFRPGVSLNPAARKILFGSSSLERRRVVRIDGEWVHGRAVNDKQRELLQNTVAVLGCGSLGSQVAARLAQVGIGNLILIDPENLSAANVGRHALGMRSVGKWKAEQLADLIKARFPHLHSVIGIPARWQELTPEDFSLIENANAVVSCIGEWAAEGPLNQWHVRSGAKTPIVYGWLGEHGATGHALVVIHVGPCLACLLNEDGNMRDCEIEWAEEQLRMTEPACGTAFHPFGPIELAHTEVLVADLVVDLLSGKQNENCHRVYATCTDRVRLLGGTWSQRHLDIRNGFDGHMEFVRQWVRRADCPVCGGA